MKMTTTKNLPTTGCWIHENNRYRCTLDISSLPYVDSKYECILNAHDIPYRKFVKSSNDHFGGISLKEFCEYWNPNVFEEKEVSLPLYAKMPDSSYYYCKKNYFQKAPTIDTIKAAKVTEKFIEEKIEEYENVLCEVSRYTFAKKQLNGGIVKMCISDELWEIAKCDSIFVNEPYFSGYISYYSGYICMNNDFYIIMGLRNTPWVAIFNMHKIDTNGHITISVPNQIAGILIGRNHANIKAWAKVIGVKEIHVIPY